MFLKNRQVERGFLYKTFSTHYLHDQGVDPHQGPIRYHPIVRDLPLIGTGLGAQEACFPFIASSFLLLLNFVAQFRHLPYPTFLSARRGEMPRRCLSSFAFFVWLHASALPKLRVQVFTV